MSKAEDAFLDGLREPEKSVPPVVAKLANSVQRQISQRSIFSNPETHPVVLDLALLKSFQLEWLGWLPETLFLEIGNVFKTSIAEVNKLKIMAAMTIHVSDSFLDKWEVFEKVLVAINGSIPRTDVMQPPDLPNLYAGIDTINRIRKNEFGEEVARYCAAVFLHENVHYAPEPLLFCQLYISQPYYRCRDCDKKGSALPPFDGLCSSCAGHFEHGNPFSFKPDPEAIKSGKGKNLDFGMDLDPRPVRKRFDELMSLPAEKTSSSVKETPEDIQAAKLIIAHDFVLLKEQQLQDQLRSLRGWLETS